MVFAQLYLLAGLLIVAGIATPLILLMRRPREVDPNRDGSRRAQRVGGVVFAVIAIAIGSTIFYLGERGKNPPTGPEHTRYRNLLTVTTIPASATSESPDTRIYFGATFVGTGRVEVQVSGEESYCLELPSEPTIQQIEDAVLTSLPEGAAIEQKEMAQEIWFRRDHACDLIGVYHIRHRDESLDVLGIYAVQAGDRAFAFPIRLRAGNQAAFSVMKATGTQSVDYPVLAGKRTSSDTDEITLSLLANPKDTTPWISRFPVDAERLETK
ncbi:MAG: hypothetical protein AAF488_12110 [Planctomycetota bacterium]